MASTKPTAATKQHSSKFITPWKIFQYDFKTKVENFEFTELHQAILDASTATKALEAVEGMLSHAMELGTVGQVITFLVKTSDILDGISTVLRKFPATQVPFATLLNVFLFAKEQALVASFAKLAGLRKVLRVISNDLVFAGLASMLASKPVGEAFAMAGHDVQLAESVFKPAADDNAFRTVVATSLLGALAPHPAKDAAVRSKLYDAVITMLSSVPASDLVTAAKSMNDAFTHITNVLRICGRSETDKVDAPACAPPAPHLVQIVFVRFLTEIVVDRSMDPLSNAMLRLLYGMKPHSMLIASADLTALFDVIHAARLSEPSIRLLVLYVSAKLVQAEYFHIAIVALSLDSISNIGSQPDERTVALQLILGLLQKPETHTYIDTNLTAERIRDCFNADIQSKNANLRTRWVCFIHMYTHAVGLTFSSLFVPLSVHVANNVITAAEFKTVTKWEWSEAKDRDLVQRIQSVHEQQVAVTGEQSTAREAIVDDELEQRRSLLEKYATRMSQLFADPRYVKWRRLRDEAMEDHSKICDDRIISLETLSRKLKTDGKQIDDQLRKGVEETVQAAIAAHEAELRGIVWDSEELAGKKAVLDARITRLRRNAEKQSSDNKTLTSWRDDLVGAMIGAMHKWNRSQLLRSSLLIVEKEEERIRGDGLVSSVKWFSSNQNSIIAREAETRRRIYALMDGDDEVEELEEEEEGLAASSPSSPHTPSIAALQKQASLKLQVSKLLGQKQSSFVERMKRVTNHRVARLQISNGEEPFGRLFFVEATLRQLIEVDRDEQVAYLRLFKKRASTSLTALHIYKSQPSSSAQLKLMTSMGSAVDLLITHQKIVLDERDDNLVKSVSHAAFDLARVKTAAPSQSRFTGGPTVHDHVADVEPISSEDDSRSNDEGWHPISPDLAGEIKAHKSPIVPPLPAPARVVTPAMLALEKEFADTRVKVVESEWQWRVYHFQHFEHGHRRCLMQSEYQDVRRLTVKAMESKSRQAVAQSEREWFAYISKQFIAKQPPSATPLQQPATNAFLQLSVTSIGSTGFDNIAEPVFNAWKDRRARILKHFSDFMRNMWEMKDAVFVRFGGLAKIAEAEQSARQRILHSAWEFIEYSARALKDETRMAWPSLLLIEQERSWRGQVCLEEVIALSVILHDRPRGKRYRPAKEEIAEEKPRLETSTANRIKNWQKECIPSDIPERSDSASWWGVKGEAEPDDEALFRNNGTKTDAKSGDSPGNDVASPTEPSPGAEDISVQQRTQLQVLSDRPSGATTPQAQEVPSPANADEGAGFTFVVEVHDASSGQEGAQRNKKRRTSVKFVGAASESSDSPGGSVAVSNIGVGHSDHESQELSRRESFANGTSSAGVTLRNNEHLDPKLSEMSDALAAYHTALQKVSTIRAHRERLRVDFESYFSREILALSAS